MMTLLYFLVIAATFIVLSRTLPGMHVISWASAILGALILAVVNAVLKPILFILTLPLTIVTLGLFLFVINMIMLKITAALVPGLSVDGWGTTFIASIVLSVVGMLWKSMTRQKSVETS